MRVPLFSNLSRLRLDLYRHLHATDFIQQRRQLTISPMATVSVLVWEHDMCKGFKDAFSHSPRDVLLGNDVAVRKVARERWVHDALGLNDFPGI